MVLRGVGVGREGSEGLLGALGSMSSRVLNPVCLQKGQLGWAGLGWAGLVLPLACSHRAAPDTSSKLLKL